MIPTCPSCGYKFAHDDTPGRLYKCPDCGKFFRVGNDTSITRCNGRDSDEHVQPYGVPSGLPVKKSFDSIHVGDVVVIIFSVAILGYFLHMGSLQESKKRLAYKKRASPTPGMSKIEVDEHVVVGIPALGDYIFGKETHTVIHNLPGRYVSTSPWHTFEPGYYTINISYSERQFLPGRDRVSTSAGSVQFTHEFESGHHYYVTGSAWGNKPEYRVVDLTTGKVLAEF